MVVEVINFLIKTTIKDKKDGQFKELSKKVDLKVDWKNGQGLINPKWEEWYSIKDKRHLPQFDAWVGKGEVVQFEKDGKKYDIVVNFTVKKGWFKNKAEVDEFRPFSPNATFITYSTCKWEERKDMKCSIEPTQSRWENYVLVGIVFTIILVIIFIFWYKKVKKKQK